ncbi:MAG TPA: VanW family protein [Thermomicrobiales bacterium]|nr:VanW family protein [Thermomicrobiales bacterium]
MARLGRGRGAGTSGEQVQDASAGPGEPRPPSFMRQAGIGLTRLGVAATALLLIAAVGLFAFRTLYSDRIYPAVVVGDVQVGGLTPSQATEKVAARANQLEGSLVSFRYGGQTWTPSLTDLGAVVDVDGGVAEAQKLGRTGDTTEKLAFTNEILRGDQVVPLRTSIDHTALNAWFDQVDADIDQRAVDATIVMDGSSPKIMPEADGLIVDREAATAQILASLQSLQPLSAELPTMVEHPEVRAADLQAHYDEIATALKSTFSLTFEGQTLSLPATDLAPYVIVETTSRGEVHVALDVDELAGYLNETFAGQINRKPVDATIVWGGSEVVATTSSVDGATLKPKALAQALSDGFLSGKPVAVPVAVTKPEIDSNNLAALKIQGLISRGDSNFSGGGGPRDTNIYIGAELANGTLVRPGEDYSFNGAIGAITEDKGYVVSNVIFGDTAGTDIGGGICQISTTVFRAALMGGFPITEWHPHAFQIANYEYDGWGAGFDASILQVGDPSNWGDFRFTNDTGGWLLVHTWTDYPHVIVEIYGPAMDRTVEIQNYWTGVQDTGATSAGFTRVVKDGDGKVLYERDFPTYFLVPKAADSTN